MSQTPRFTGFTGFAVPPALSSLLLSGFVFTALLSSGCDKKTADSGPGASAVAATGSQSSEELGMVLATIDGVEISVGEFQTRINKQSPYVRARYTSTEQKKDFLDNLIRFEVLAQEAKNKGYDRDSDVVRAMKQIMIQKLMKARFENGITPDDVSDEEMKAHYEESQAEYHKPEEVRVTAIIIKKKSAADRVARMAHAEPGATNKGFRELVAKNSTDAESRERGGDLRYFTQASTSIPKPVIAAAFELKKTGDVAGPIDAGDGRFFIIKQTGHRKAVDKTFEQVRRQIQNRLYRAKRTSAQTEYVGGLRTSAKIEIFEDKLRMVQIDTSGSAEASGDHMPPMPKPDLPASDSSDLPKKKATP